MTNETKLDLVGHPTFVAVYEGERLLENGRDYVREGDQLRVTTDRPDALSVKELVWLPKSVRLGFITQEAYAALSPADRQRFSDGEI